MTRASTHAAIALLAGLALASCGGGDTGDDRAQLPPPAPSPTAPSVAASPPAASPAASASSTPPPGTSGMVPLPSATPRSGRRPRTRRAAPAKPARRARRVRTRRGATVMRPGQRVVPRKSTTGSDTGGMVVAGGQEKRTVIKRRGKSKPTPKRTTKPDRFHFGPAPSRARSLTDEDLAGLVIGRTTLAEAARDLPKPVATLRRQGMRCQRYGVLGLDRKTVLEGQRWELCFNAKKVLALRTTVTLPSKGEQAAAE